MNLLEMNHVKKSFGDLGVIQDISLHVGEGEIVSIIGPSGSGKSTALCDHVRDDGQWRADLPGREGSVE